MKYRSCWLIYTRYLHRWLPLGVLDRGFIRSNSVLLEVNDFGVVIGGSAYETEHELYDPQPTVEVKLLNPSGPHFSLWDLPYMLEPRTKHAAVAIPGTKFVSDIHIDPYTQNF